MRILRGRPALLALGDVVALAAALYLALAARGLELPSRESYLAHLQPFSILAAAWLLVFFVAGLYDRHAAIKRRTEPQALLYAQLVNSLFAVAFFYFIPYFGIAPKTVLFIFLGASFALLVAWRWVFWRLAAAAPAEGAVVIGRGEELRQFCEEVNRRGGYRIMRSINLDASPEIDVQDDVVRPVYELGATTVILDTQDAAVAPILAALYNLMFANVSFVSLHGAYEEVFGRVPPSMVSHGWFLENVQTKPHVLYDAAKRAFDVALSLPILAVTALVLPFVWVARRLEGDVPVISYQDRVGQGGRTIRLVKFATMLFDDNGQWGERKNAVTRVGRVLRRTRIDELPQAWNVLRGDLSLIGPRPEFPQEARAHAQTIPYYNARHLIKPGLTGWAQIYGEHVHHRVDEGVMRNKLSHDLYYVKNRSFWLDLVIALRTAATLARMEGR
jgi:exopolysaccharide biosynthesis polyprenyl glycosylphosphotransferase